MPWRYLRGESASLRLNRFRALNAALLVSRRAARLPAVSHYGGSPSISSACLLTASPPCRETSRTFQPPVSTSSQAFLTFLPHLTRTELNISQRVQPSGLLWGTGERPCWMTFLLTRSVIVFLLHRGAAVRLIGSDQGVKGFTATRSGC